VPGYAIGFALTEGHGRARTSKAAAGWLGRSGVAWRGVYGARSLVRVWRGPGVAAEALLAMGDAQDFSAEEHLPRPLPRPLLSPGILQPPHLDPATLPCPPRFV